MRIQPLLESHLGQHDYIISTATQFEKVVAVGVLRKIPLVRVNIALLDYLYLYEFIA